MKSFKACAFLVLVLSGSAAVADDGLSFNRDVRPILSNNCFACHGPDENTRSSGLRLDEEEAVLKTHRDGLPAIAPGDRAKSLVWQRITEEDPERRMPPATFHRSLDDEDIETLGRWIDAGAPWEPHWAFIAPERPVVPGIAEADWTRNPIDNFIYRRLEENDLQPSPEADRRALARRLAFDLTGLPPTLEQVRDFVEDEREDAYERLVDQLLESPHYGEHMARHWLDAGRYADTNGYHIDNERFMWVWRDWVIDAFNGNLSYADFTRWQIAGDLLPEPTEEQLIATGFHRNHMINFEGGAIPEEYRSQYVADRINTTGTIWMGLTLSCAQCHDHKYDPISHREYFELFAFFNNIDEEGLDGVEGNAKPMMPVPTESQRTRMDELRTAIAASEQQLEEEMPEVDAAQADWESEWRGKLADRWEPAEPSAVVSQGGAAFERLDDGSWLATGENPDQDTYEITIPLEDYGYTAFRLEALAHESHENGAAGRSPNGNLVLTGVEAVYVPAGEEEGTPVVFIDAQADLSQDNYGIQNAIDGDAASGWAIDGHNRPGDRLASFTFAEPVGMPGGGELRLHLRQESPFSRHTIGRFRVSLTTDEAMRPSRAGTWYVSGPYQGPDGDSVYHTDYGPEAAYLEGTLDLRAAGDDGRYVWHQDDRLADGVIHNLYGDIAATYFYRVIQSPGARQATLKVGSNDAVKIWLNGRVVHDNNVKRGVALDQDTVKVLFDAGENRLLMKVVNYGNRYGFAYRLAEEELGPVPLAVEAALQVAADDRDEAAQERLRQFYRSRYSPAFRELDAQLAELREELRAIEKDVPTTMVLAERETPRETRILLRGQYDMPGDPVTPNVPAILPPLPEDQPKNRLALAEWLVDPAHPLTARVTVNRYWMYLFGDGLVETVEDFGIQGDWPRHPDLLDWLAVEFVESGWDVKALLRLMVTSATYRQQAHSSPELQERDPSNRLLARAPRYRLDAESVRDNALALSGLLVPRIGGPSVNPYQPPGLWEAVSYGAGYTAQNFVQDHGDDLYRRSMYTFWKRQSPPASMMVFDAPNRETCTIRRARTNTPLQALALMNDPQIVEAARFLAERMMREGGESVAERVAFGFEVVTARTPTAQEAELLAAYFEEQREHYADRPEAAEALLHVGESPADPALAPEELSAWAMVASLLLNMDLTIMRS